MTEMPTVSIPDKTVGLRILIVEDYDDGAESMAVLLRLFGHDVQIARNGPEALAAARADMPDLVLLDIGLPGMDGYEVARQLHNRLKMTPMIIAVTGFGQEDDRQRSAAAGIDLHLVKPVEPDQLQAVLGRYQQQIYSTSAGCGAT